MTERTSVPAALRRALSKVDLSLLVLGFLVLVLIVLVVLPIGWILYYAGTDNAWSASAASLAFLLTDPSFLKAAWATLLIGVFVSVISCLAALPLAWLVARTNMPLSRAVHRAILFIFITPPFLGAIGWEMLAAPNSGLLNRFARVAFNLSDDQAIFNIYSLAGVIFVEVTYAIPYVFVFLANAFERIPGDLEDASAILGANRFATLRRITVPMVVPALLAGAIVSFLGAVTQFGTPAILAQPAGFSVITTKIWGYFQYPPKPHLAAAACIPIVIVTMLLLWLQSRILGNRGYTVVGGKSGGAARFDLGRLRWPALLIVAIIVAVPVLLPNLIIIKAAFSTRFFAPFNLDSLTLHNVSFVFRELPQTGLVLENTLICGLAAATGAVIIALAVSYVTTRQLVPGATILGVLAVAPMAFPGIVLGVGLFVSYTRPPFQLYGTLWILLLAFITIELPAAFQQLRATFRGIHPELEEASRILGATRLRALRDITMPVLSAGIVAVWGFIFIGVIRELSATILLTTSRTKIVSVLIYDLNESGDLGAIAVLGLALMAVTVVVLGIANRLKTSAPVGLTP